MNKNNDGKDSFFNKKYKNLSKLLQNLVQEEEPCLL